MISIKEGNIIFLMLENNEGLEYVESALEQYKVKSGVILSGFGELNKISYKVAEFEEEQEGAIVSEMKGIVSNSKLSYLLASFSKNYKSYNVFIKNFEAKRLFLIIKIFDKIRIKEIEGKFSIGYEE